MPALFEKRAAKLGNRRITAGRARVNRKTSRLNNKDPELGRLLRPLRLDEGFVLFPEVPRRRRDDCLLANHDLAILLHGLPHVLFADEIGGWLRCGSFRGYGASGC